MLEALRTIPSTHNHSSPKNFPPFVPSNLQPKSAAARTVFRPPGASLSSGRNGFHTVSCPFHFSQGTNRTLSTCHVPQPESSEHKRGATGPRTLQGKRRSSRNSFKHGLYSKELVLPFEDAAELDELRVSLRAEHQPANTTEEILVNELAEQFWRLRRMRNFETRALQPDTVNSELDLKLVAFIQRSMTTAERSFHKSLAALRQLQKDRQFVPSKTGSTIEEIEEQEQSADAHAEAVEFVPSKHINPTASAMEDLLDSADLENHYWETIDKLPDAA
jgi:hypothetical protein